VIGGIVYSLCAITALVCSYLLLQAYRRGGYRLLLWSGICFAGLTVNNLFLVFDKLVVPDLDLSLVRTSVALVSMAILLYGLIWDTQ
jgi:hypothetical protein